MIKTLFELQAIDFLERLFLKLDDFKIEISTHWDIDHLCYRVESVARYEELKKHFLNFGKLLIESEINGRPIATFKLNSAIVYKDWVLDVVELPSPKASRLTAEGFEHVEVVCDLSFSELIKKYDHLKLDTAGLNKDFNQELEIKLGEVNLKFHHISLESVIRIERNKLVFSALKDSMILQRFKENWPIVVGDYPLGIQTQNSHIKILMCAFCLDSLESSLISHYKNYDGFEYLKSFLDGVETLIVNFNVNDVPFEILAQKRDTVEQKSFKCFQFEERLLKRSSELKT